MHFNHDLPGIIGKLIAIECGGRLGDLQNDLAEACRGPHEPLDRFPHYRLTVEHYTRLAANLLGLPVEDCRAAAIEAILPTTRLRVALAIIEEYHERLQADVVRDFAQAKLARERRRVQRW